jgi:hypothetical protein
MFALEMFTGPSRRRDRADTGNGPVVMPPWDAQTPICTYIPRQTRLLRPNSTIQSPCA